MADEIDWGAILQAQSGEDTKSEEEPLVTTCNESADKLISYEIFTLKEEKEDKQQKNVLLIIWCGQSIPEIECARTCQAINFQIRRELDVWFGEGKEGKTL